MNDSFSGQKQLFLLFIYINKNTINYSIEKILKFKIKKNKKKFDKKKCFIYKIKYENYDEKKDFSK